MSRVQRSKCVMMGFDGHPPLYKDMNKCPLNCLISCLFQNIVAHNTNRKNNVRLTLPILTTAGEIVFHLLPVAIAIGHPLPHLKRNHFSSNVIHVFNFISFKFSRNLTLFRFFLGQKSSIFKFFPSSI